jgi:hypothetical protein
MKRLLLPLTVLAACVALAVPVMAMDDDGPIVVDGITFDTVLEYIQSDYFKENGKRCGTIVDPTEGGQPMLPGTPADCGNATNPSDDYDASFIIEIPVVVHNITTTSNLGYLTDANIISQIVVLNEDFRALPGTPGAPGSDTMIQFVLATVDPDGNPTNGIDRVQNNTWFNDAGGYYYTLAWDAERYLNIYTLNPGGGILGYVPFLPHQGAVGSPIDRVVIWYRAFGDPGSYPPYHLGRTATHEVGHYLGLYHTFQSGCGTGTPPYCYTTGDRICDTNQEQNQRFGCPNGAQSCSSPDPIHNYMDYTDDYCMNHYTFEQGRRSRCTLEHYRPDLRNNLVAVGDRPMQIEMVDLLQNVPNPFNPKTAIRFELTQAAGADMQIVDVSGRILREFAMGELAAGSHELIWDGQNYRGEQMSSGVYFYRLKVEGQMPITKRMVMVK